MTPTPDGDITRRAIECAIIVHRELGSGFSSEIYETCMTMELDKAGLAYERGRVLTAIYDGHPLDCQDRADIIVADCLLIQIEAVDALELIHEQRLRTCLWMSGLPLGVMLNFNVMEMADGITRIVPYVVGEQEISPDGYDVFDDLELGGTL